MLKKIQNIIITIVILLSIPIITMGVASIYSDGANLKTIATQFHIDGIVGINNTGPDRKLDILDATNPQLRLTHTDGSVYVDMQGTSAGHLSISGSGGNIGIGTTTPYHALQVDGAIQCDGFWGDMAHLEVYSTTTQTIAVVNTAQEVIFEGIADEHGDWNIDTGVSTSTVYIPNTGTYLATYEFQPSQSTGGTNVFEFAAFLAGTELLASTQQRTLSGTSDIGDSDRTIHFEADAGDAFLIKMAGDDTAIQISATSSVFTTASSYNLIIHQLDGE